MRVWKVEVEVGGVCLYYQSYPRIIFAVFELDGEFWKMMQIVKYNILLGFIFTKLEDQLSSEIQIATKLQLSTKTKMYSQLYLRFNELGLCGWLFKE